MTIGSLGDIRFFVSSELIQTINDLTFNRSPKFDTHSVHNRAGVLEYTGRSPDTISFTLRSSKVLGASPMEVKELLDEYAEEAKLLSFNLGADRIGKYRWVISKYKAAVKNYDRSGNPIDIEFSITITEYLRRSV